MNRVRQIAASPFILFSAALCTRLAAVVYLFTKFPAQLLYVRNEPSHVAAALASGLGFASPYAHIPIAPTAQQPPLYPLILAGIFKVFGICSAYSAWVSVGLNVAAASLTAIVIYRLGKAYFHETSGIVAAWLWVLPWGFQARAFTLSLTNAHLAALGFAALLLWFPKAIKGGRGWLAIGIYSGLLLLLQPAFLVVFVAYGAGLAFSKMRSPRMWLAVAAMVVVLAPWTVRNYLVFQRFIPFRDNFGLELWLGNRPGMQGVVDYSVDFPGNDPTNYVRLGETAFMDAKLRESREFITRDPGSFVERCLSRVVKFWYIPYARSWIAFSLLAWLGAVLAWKRCDLSWLLAIPLATFPVVYYVTHPYAHYRFPIDPVIMLLATYAVVEVTRQIGRKVA
jgi:hypothetical protein